MATAVKTEGKTATPNPGQPLFNWQKKIEERGDFNTVVIITEWRNKNVPEAAIRLVRDFSTGIPAIRVAESCGPVMDYHPGHSWPAVTTEVPVELQKKLARLRPGWIKSPFEVGEMYCGTAVPSGSGYVIVTRCRSRKGNDFLRVVNTIGHTKHHTDATWAIFPHSCVPEDIRDWVRHL